MECQPRVWNVAQFISPKASYLALKRTKKKRLTKNETLKKTYGNPFKKVTLRGELLNVAG